MLSGGLVVVSDKPDHEIDHRFSDLLELRRPDGTVFQATSDVFFLTRRATADRALVENLKKFLPNVVFAVPTLYRMLLEEKKWPQEHIVRLLFSAGAPLSEEIRNAWRASFGFEIYEGIGTTELCHVYATSYPDAVWPGSVGRMVPLQTARNIVTTETMIMFRTYSRHDMEGIFSIGLDHP